MMITRNSARRLFACAWIALFGLAFMAPTQAAFIITGGSNNNLPVSGNDYNGDLSGLGFDAMREGGYLSVDMDGFVTFRLVGAESAFENTFTVTEHPSLTTSSITELGGSGASKLPFTFGGIGASITIAVTAGERLDFQFSNDTNSNIVNNTLSYTLGRLYDLGIVYDTSAIALEQLVLAYDDQFSTIGVDDNHDDMLIRVDFSPVPVPAAVWLFGSGLIGLAGVARRKKTE